MKHKLVMAVRFFAKKSWNTSLLYMRSPCGVLHRFLSTSSPEPVDRDTVFKPLSAEDISPKSNDPLAGRKWLPGAQGKGFPEFLGKPKQDFPHALNAVASDQFSIKQLSQVSRRVIDSDLSKYGAIVLRGLPLPEAKDFSEFSSALGYKGMEYVGGAANRQVVNSSAHVYTASDDPGLYTIELHNEMAYAPIYPRKLMFFCLDEPEEGCGGYTVICRSSDFVPKIDPDVLKRIEEKKVRYVHQVPDKARSSWQSWQQMFETTEKSKVESFLEKEGFTYSWDPKLNSLSYWITLPPFIPHPDTGEKIWFNHIHRKHITGFKESPMFPGDDKLDSCYIFSSFYGDGSEIEPEVIQHIRATIWSCSVGFQWRQGDVLLVDNMTTLHGRLGYTGKRKILASLFSD